MKRERRLWTSLAAGCAVAASAICASAQDAPAAPVREFAMPKALIEISGLAGAGEATVFAHGDEYAIIHEIDLASGDVIRAFAMGDPTEAGDFEGIATRAGRVYLITSAGLIYESDIGEHRKRVRHNVYDTGVGALCEIEGLDVGPEDGDFLILCKRPLTRAGRNRLVIYKWSLSERRAVDEPWLSVPLTGIVAGADRDGFRPAGLSFDGRTGSLYIVSSRSGRIYHLSESGALRGVIKLDGKLHLQTEGISVTARGDLILADEGARKGPGMVRVYRLPRDDLSRD